MWGVILIALFCYVSWQTGAYDKYPELLVPLFFIYMGVIAPCMAEKPEFERKWKQLEKRRMKAVKADDIDEQVKIEEQREKLELYNTPLTVGHLNTFRSDLDRHLIALENRISSIEENLKATISNG